MTPSGIPDASADHHGLMSAAAFTKVAALSGTNTGDVSIGTGNGLSIVGQALSLALAGSGQAGAVSAAAQSLYGLKSFPDGIGNDLGSGANDIVQKIGSSLPAASWAASWTNRLLSVRTGIGGSEFEYFGVKPSSALTPVVIITAPTTSNHFHMSLNGGNAGWSGIHQALGNGGQLIFGQYSHAMPGVEAVNRGITIGQNANAYDASHLQRFIVQNANGVASSVPLFDFQAPANTQSGQKVLRAKVNTTDVFSVDNGGNLAVAGQLSGAGIVAAGTSFYAASGGMYGNGNFALRLGSARADGATAVAVEIYSANTFANATAKLLSAKNVNSEKFCLYADGEAEVFTAGKGLIVTSPDGLTRRRIGIDNAGALSITTV